jgi:hypothetical protein
MSIRFLFTLAIILTATSSQAQFLFNYNPNLPVTVGGVELENPWAGGLNYAQFSDIDFDFDGDMDLFVFDRSSDNIRVFTQEGTGSSTHYELAYNAKNSFPTDLRYRTTMVDYDNDGRNDIFTYGIGGLMVYRNVGDLTTGLQWELISELLYTEYLGVNTNLYVSSSDIPAIVDVDGDGDIDVLTFHIGGQHMLYYQNQSMELYGIPDSLTFELRNECWGKFQEDFSTSSILLNDPNAPCVGGSIPDPELTGNIYKGPKHAGSTVLAFDADNSGVLDLVIGDVSYPNLNLLMNGGTTVNTDSPIISVDNAFPSNTTPANMQLFPAAFFVDVDFDGVKDMIVAANAKNISQNVNSVIFYKNIGTNALPNFIFVQDDFLQAEMIETGSGSKPIIVDINEDGLEDLIVANFFRYKPIMDKETTLSYYQNTGTANDPEFSFVDDNYLDLPDGNYGLRALPTFGDIDGDGDKDMFLGLEDGHLAYSENMSVGAGSVYGLPVIDYLDNLGAPITSGGFNSPQLFDIDDDGLLDLLLGGKTGEIAYYRNIGSSTVPSFELTNPSLGSVNTTDSNPDGYSTPHFVRDSGNVNLFCGDLSGRMHHYTDIDGNLSIGDTFNLETLNHQGISTEGYSSIFIADINNNDKLEAYVGQDLGGLFRFENDSTSTASNQGIVKDVELLIYPNPTGGMITVASNDNQLNQVTLFNLAGQQLLMLNPVTNSTQIDFNNLPSGVYIIHVGLSTGDIITRKVLKK